VASTLPTKKKLAIPSKKKLARLVAERALGESEARRLLGDAVAVRGKILRRLRRLRKAYARLGAAAYLHLKERAEPRLDDDSLDAEALKMSIDGLHSEIAQLREQLDRLLKPSGMEEALRGEPADDSQGGVGDDEARGKDVSDLF